MAMFADLYGDIRIEAEGCPLAVIDRALSQTLRHFCRETHFWLHDIEPVTLLTFLPSAPATYLYELSCPPNSEVLTIDELVINGRPLRMVSDSWLDDNLAGWREADGEPRYFLQLSDRRVRFVPASDAVRPNAVSGRVVLSPDRKAKSFGDTLMQFDQGIARGAVSRILGMDKPWANPHRAAAAQLEYLDSVSEARCEAIQRFSSGPEVITPRPWL